MRLEKINTDYKPRTWKLYARPSMMRKTWRKSSKDCITDKHVQVLCWQKVLEARLLYKFDKLHLSLLSCAYLKSCEFKFNGSPSKFANINVFKLHILSLC